MKHKTAFKIIRRQIVQFAMRTHGIVKVHTMEIQSGDEGATPHFKVVQFFMNLAENFSR